MPIKRLFVFLSLLVGLASSCAAQEQDCEAIGKYRERERCMASSPDYADCKDTDSSCAPYRKMDSAERLLDALNRKLLTLKLREYATYTDDDPNYLRDLKKSSADADRTWRSYRDAQCEMELFIQGMTRHGNPGLVESCRLDKTQKRIRELNFFMPSLKDQKDQQHVK
jgi:uncharacterized protein YecT (DUF1311 family)